MAAKASLSLLLLLSAVVAAPVPSDHEVEVYPPDHPLYVPPKHDVDRIFEDPFGRQVHHPTETYDFYRPEHTTTYDYDYDHRPQHTTAYEYDYPSPHHTTRYGNDYYPPAHHPTYDYPEHPYPTGRPHDRPSHDRPSHDRPSHDRPYDDEYKYDCDEEPPRHVQWYGQWYEWKYNVPWNPEHPDYRPPTHRRPQHDPWYQPEHDDQYQYPPDHPLYKPDHRPEPEHKPAHDKPSHGGRVWYMPYKKNEHK